FDEFPLEVRLEGHLLFYQNEDRPGMLATVGGLLAEADINIAGLSLGREAPGTRAITVLSTDQPLPGQVVRDLHQIKGVDSVFVVSL
ncbi:MAG: ACT domain-containing protein, partial [Rubricoccaceae bacterium]|nr:ACT domain-containing protein [Rubricoccaceae bacterium]